jgi:serine phosphatase RsbU (regulator of sigma subunit)
MPKSGGLLRKIDRFIGESLLLVQLRLVLIGLVIGITFWFFQGKGGFFSTFVYTFVVGNITSFTMGPLGRRIGGLAAIRRWTLFVLCLIPVALIGSVLGSLAMYALPTTRHANSVGVFLLSNAPVGIFVTILVSITVFMSVNKMHLLEKTNQQLRDQVQLGTIRLQGQAAELMTAHEIQAHLIPANLPQIDGLQISGAWQPANAVGGDYFDVIPFSPTRLGVCIADVSGKGMGAALLMANFQAAFRAFATEDTPPDKLCAKLNRALCSSIAPGKFVTFFYGIVDMTHLLFDYANAGHSQPILLRGDTIISLVGGGTVLGLFPHLVYDALTIGLQPGDCLLLTTDGITEAANPSDLDEEFGEDRLIECARSVRTQGAHAIRSRILEEVTSFCAGQFQDDASLIVLTIDAAKS